MVFIVRDKLRRQDMLRKELVVRVNKIVQVDCICPVAVWMQEAKKMTAMTSIAAI